MDNGRATDGPTSMRAKTARPILVPVEALGAATARTERAENQVATNVPLPRSPWRTGL